MSTKTMRLPPRRVITPSTSSNKRKERESCEPCNALQPSTPNKPSKPTATTTTAQFGSEPSTSNQLLAGYLAHEFLSKGTLFGKPWDPTPGEEAGGDIEKGKPSENDLGAELKTEYYQRYVEVAHLLKKDGAHLPGIVNPTQLAHFLHL